MVHISILPGADENPSSTNAKAKDKDLRMTKTIRNQLRDLLNRVIGMETEDP
jgi:trehalose-6-phosphatase